MKKKACKKGEKIEFGEGKGFAARGVDEEDREGQHSPNRPFIKASPLLTWRKGGWGYVGNKGSTTLVKKYAWDAFRGFFSGASRDKET